MTNRRSSGLRELERCGKPGVSTKPGMTVCTWIPLAASSAAVERENASCACFAAEYAPAGAKATVPATETRFTTCARRRRRAEPRLERAQAPDPAEVVHRGHALHELRLDVEEAAARRNAGVVHEQPDRWMPLEHARGDLVHLRPVGDVADLELAADLGRDALELLRSARQQHAVPALSRELACGRLADAGRGPRDHRDALAGHRRATLSE